MDQFHQIPLEKYLKRPFSSDKNSLEPLIYYYLVTVVSYKAIELYHSESEKNKDKAFRLFRQIGASFLIRHYDYFYLLENYKHHYHGITEFNPIVSNLERFITKKREQLINNIHYLCYPYQYESKFFALTFEKRDHVQIVDDLGNIVHENISFVHEQDAVLIRLHQNGQLSDTIIEHFEEASKELQYSYFALLDESFFDRIGHIMNSANREPYVTPSGIINNISDSLHLNYSFGTRFLHFQLLNNICSCLILEDLFMDMKYQFNYRTHYETKIFAKEVKGAVEQYKAIDPDTRDIKDPATTARHIDALTFKLDKDGNRTEDKHLYDSIYQNLRLSTRTS